MVVVIIEEDADRIGLSAFFTECIVFGAGEQAFSVEADPIVGCGFLVVSTDASGFAAELGVRVGVSAKSVIFDETFGAGGRTFAVATDLSWLTGRCVASAAMVGVGLDIDTGSVAVCIAGSAEDLAGAFDADFVSSTRFSTCSTVLGVGIGISTKAFAELEMRSADGLTLTVIARLARITFGLAVATEVWICLGVDADIVTGGLLGGAGQSYIVVDCVVDRVIGGGVELILLVKDAEVLQTPSVVGAV